MLKKQLKKFLSNLKSLKWQLSPNCDIPVIDSCKSDFSTSIAAKNECYSKTPNARECVVQKRNEFPLWS